MLNQWITNFTRRSMSLRFAILSIFIVISIVMTVIIMGIRYVVFVDEITYAAKRIMMDVSDEVLQELNAKLSTIEGQAKFSAKLLESKVLKHHDDDLIPYTYYLVQASPLLKGVYWGDENGDFIYSKKEDDGSISTEIHNRQTKPYQQIIFHHDHSNQIKKRIVSDSLEYDHRLRPWYQQAKQRKHVMWTDVYHFYPDNNLGITYSIPIYDQGRLMGVFGLDITLDFLRNFIARQQVSKNGFAYIINADEKLIAYPDKFPFSSLPHDPKKLINVHPISLTLIDQGIDRYKLSGRTEFTLNYDGQDYLTTYQPVPELMDKGWIVGVMAPKSDFTKFLQHANIVTFFISMILLALGMLLISIVISKVVQPIRRLVEEAERIKHFELDTEMNISSNIKEIKSLHQAVLGMKKGLKQFQRYVPKLLVKQLIQSGQELSIGGDRRSLVVLFSDIENFTSISENMDPNDLMLQLCEYFDANTNVILNELGMIDKYIGDAIMAIWGAPLSVDEPYYHAARAALLCQDKIRQLNEQWLVQGKPQFVTRIGIHSGEAIVGNLGSSERLSYTALGDTVNLASRLEGINKEYHTHIIVSEAVYEKIKSQFIFRELGCVTVKGRSNKIRIYELVGFLESVASPS